MRLSLLRGLLAVTPFSILLSTSAAQVSGTVVDGSMTPVQNAWVSLQATSQRVRSAADGTFSLPGASGIGLTIVAAKKGYYNASIYVDSPVVGGTITMEPVPQTADPNYAFVDANTCSICHTDQVSQWQGSNMALAGQNLWTYDLYDGTGTPGGMGGFVYQNDSVHAVANPNSECASCHQPERWIKQNFVGLEDINNLSAEAMHGVSCDVCHKIAHIDDTKKNFPGIWPGVVTHTRPDTLNGETQVEYGVLDADFQLASLMRPSYQPQLTSTMCCACHQDKVDSDGDGDFEEAHEPQSEPTYLEWLASPYADPLSPLAASCVSCHMPSYGAVKVCVLGGVPTRDPEQVRYHRIEGTTAPFLEEALDLKVKCRTASGDLEVTVRVKNTGGGHHVPTGVPLRNVILLVEATRTIDDKPLAHTGSQTINSVGGVGNPAQGYYAGLPGKVFAKSFEDALGNTGVWFTEAVDIAWDTRIPALATDVTNYTFAIPRGTGKINVRARLIYRRADRATVDSKSWTTDGHGNPLADIQAPHFGHLMEEVNKVIAVANPETTIERP